MISHRPHKIIAGFTLVELVAVMVIVATLGMFALPKFSHNDATVPAQAEQLGRILRHAQSLAMSQGRSLTVDVQSTTRYAITDGITTTPIRDPSGQEQIYSLKSRVVLSSGNAKFDSLGRPITINTGNLISSVQTWTLTGDSNTATVSIQPLTGFVTVTP